jgi:DNA-binding transcriptional MerR regulator
MLTIGEFSSATKLTVKALRIYHDEGFLVPEKIDPANGYRYYGDESFAKAQTILLLRELGFSVREMGEILASCRDDADLVGFFQGRLGALEREMDEKRKVRDRIRYFLEKEAVRMEEIFAVTEKDVEPVTICGIRYREKYADIGTRFSALFGKAGRWAKGAPFALYYDGEYRENDADIEAAIAVKKAVSIPGAECRVLPGGRAVCVRYRGPYDGIGAAYKRLFEYLGEKGHEAKTPTMEIYLKGPGMILPRSPKNFVTEIRILI